MGNGQAQHNLGAYYVQRVDEDPFYARESFGEILQESGPLQDLKESQRWLDLAHKTQKSSSGPPLICPIKGQRNTKVDRNSSASVSSLNAAANGGDTMALVELSINYISGRGGVKKDLKKGLGYIEDILSSNDSEAIYAVGLELVASDFGLGPKMGAYMLGLAAKNGHADAQYKYAVHIEAGIGVERDKKVAVEYYSLAAKQGVVFAIHNLGTCYWEGSGVERDEDVALQHFQHAVDLGNALTQYRLGVHYLNGLGVEKDPTKAVNLFREAAKQGDEHGQYNLGVCYQKGLGVKKDMEKGAKWIRLSAEQGNVLAQSDLALCYDYGRGVKQDIKEAMKWYRKAADTRDDVSLCSFAWCFHHGNGVKKDPKEAMRYYLAAAMNGSSHALKAVGILATEEAGSIFVFLSKLMFVFLVLCFIFLASSPIFFLLPFLPSF